VGGVGGNARQKNLINKALALAISSVQWRSANGANSFAISFPLAAQPQNTAKKYCQEIPKRDSVEIFQA